ncbi:MAG: flagellar protein [Eubacterium sp.]|nr:flagellar protein [Eubacterium sp.]
MNIEQIRDMYPGSVVNKARSQNDAVTDEAGATFGDYLIGAKKADDVIFSKHAARRIDSRQIEMSDEQRQRLNAAADKARGKGLKESLVMVDNMAFIVNIKNNTVVTAVNDTEKKVFTNIDGAIIG